MIQADAFPITISLKGQHKHNSLGNYETWLIAQYRTLSGSAIRCGAHCSHLLKHRKWRISIPRWMYHNNIIMCRGLVLSVGASIRGAINRTVLHWSHLQVHNSFFRNLGSAVHSTPCQQHMVDMRSACHIADQPQSTICVAVYLAVRQCTAERNLD